MQKNGVSYCGELVRKYDADKFLLSMFARSDMRGDLWTLFAFNHEIAKTREVVSEQTLGLIRLQWWRDEIAKIYDGAKFSDHEVIKPLAQVISHHNLPREHFDKLIYAREFDLEGVPPADVDGLINYADYTTTPLLSLATQITGGVEAQEVVRGVAVNFALAGLLRARSHNERQGCFLLPKGAGSKDIIAYKLSCSGLNNVMLKGFDALSNIYFKQIKSLDYDVMSPALQNEPALKALRLFCRVKIL